MIKAAAAKHKSQYSARYFPAIDFTGGDCRKVRAAVYDVAAILERGSISKQWAIVPGSCYIYIELATDDRSEYDEAEKLVANAVFSYNQRISCGKCE